MLQAARLVDEPTGPERDFGATLSPELAATIEARRANYVARLLKHDWHHEFAPTNDIARRGRNDRAWLMLEAATVDPGYELWNRHCPAEYRRGVV